MTNSDKYLGLGTPYVNAANRSINVGGTAFAYRDLGPRSGVPLILLNHWGAVLDNFDPRIIDGLASRHRVIATDYRGVGASGGKDIDKVGSVSWPLMMKGLLTLRDPKFYLFFTSTANGRQAAKSFLKRLKEHKANRDEGHILPQ